MRRTAVVALATAALLTSTGIVAGQAAAQTPAAHVSSAHSATLIAAQARHAVRVIRLQKKRAAAITFHNAHAAKPAAKKPTAKKPVAKKPVAKKPVAKKPVAKKPVASATTSRAVALARGNRASRDLQGWRPSLYKGAWFQPEVEAIRKCIMDRESNFNYRSVGGGRYFGAYQMNRGLAVGATRTMEAEVRKEMGAEGVRILRSLRRTAPNTWNRYWQDRAFYTIWHGGAGKGNWRGGGLHCF